MNGSTLRVTDEVKQDLAVNAPGVITALALLVVVAWEPGLDWILEALLLFASYQLWVASIWWETPDPPEAPKPPPSLDKS